MRSVPLPFLSKITLLWTRAREPGPVSPVKVDSPLPFPWTQRGEIYILQGAIIQDQHRPHRSGELPLHAGSIWIRSSFKRVNSQMTLN